MGGDRKLGHALGGSRLACVGEEQREEGAARATSSRLLVSDTFVFLSFLANQTHASLIAEMVSFWPFKVCIPPSTDFMLC